MSTIRIFQLLTLTVLVAFSCSHPAAAGPAVTNAAPAAAAPPGVTGSVRVKIGLVTPAGDVKPLVRTDFTLSKVSFGALYQEECDKSVHPEFHTISKEDYCKAQKFSPELSNCLAALNWDTVAFERKIRQVFLNPDLDFIGSDGFKEAVAEFRKMPEFKPLLEQYLDTAPPGEGSVTRRRLNILQAMRHAGDALDPQVKQIETFYLKALGDVTDKSRAEQWAASKAALARAKERFQKEVMATEKSNLSGEVTFAELPPGDYFIANSSTKELEDERLHWDQKVTVTGGKEKYAEFSNDNIWRTPLVRFKND